VDELEAMRPDALSPSGDSLCALEALASPALDPFFWPAERLGVPSAWWPHVPFAHWVVGAINPRSLVELGTGNGVSYSAFCQAVERNRLATRCYAVSQWRDDPRSGESGDAVLADLQQFHDERYGAFSTLLRCSVDEALDSFPEASIDLLHIGGSQGPDAVSHDFASWRPKLSDRAVVLLHHTNEHGGSRLWGELRQRYPSFEFPHGRGLGVLAVGERVPPPIAHLCAITDASEVGSIRLRVARLGERWERDVRDRMRSREVAEARAETTQARAAAAAAAEWEPRYYALRGRLEALLRRSGLLRAWRLVPVPVRRYVHQRLLGHAPDPFAPKGARAERPVVSLTSQLAAGRSRIDPNRETVLLVVHEASRTGAPIVGYNIATHLSSKYNLIALLLKGGELVDDFDERCTAVVGPPGSSGWHLIETERLIRHLLLSFRISYVIANSIETAPLIAPLAKRGIPSVCLVHEFFNTARPHDRMEGAYGWASHVIFPARVVAESSFAAYPHLASRRGVHIIPQGRVSLPPRPSEARAAAADPRLVIRPIGAEDAFVVLGAGTLNIRKGLDLFVACAAAAKRLEPSLSFRFVWVGERLRTDLEYLIHLDEQLVRSGMQETVVFMEPVEDLDPIYAAADAFFMCSRLDPQPNVAIEAMFRGLPVVCFEGAGGTDEVLARDSQTRSLVVSYLDAHGAAEVMCRLARDPTALNDARMAVKRVAEATFDIAEYVSKVDALGRAAAGAQHAEDLQTLVDSAAVDATMALPPGAAKPRNDDAERHVIAQWAAVGTSRGQEGNPQFRRPCPGFHPQIYAQAHADDCGDGGQNPLAHWVRAGRPPGPWAHKVVSPLEPLPPPLGKVPRLALHGHFYHVETAPDLAAKLAGNRTPCDLLLSTDTAAKADRLMAVFAAHRGTVEVRVMPNRGRDMGPFLTGFADRWASGEYDVVGHVHGKRSLDWDPAGGEAWREFLWRHLIGGKFAMLDHAAAAFAADPTLGLLQAEDPHLVGWVDDREIAARLAVRMGLRESLPDFFDFPVGAMFWARSAALLPLFDLKLAWDDYPPEPAPYHGTILHAIERLLPFVASHAGYSYAATFIPGVTR
jgi:glycosyltransferase involved in cell wall biosynthesis